LSSREQKLFGRIKKYKNIESLLTACCSFVLFNYFLLQRIGRNKNLVVIEICDFPLVHLSLGVREGERVHLLDIIKIFDLQEYERFLLERTGVSGMRRGINFHDIQGRGIRIFCGARGLSQMFGHLLYNLGHASLRGLDHRRNHEYFDMALAYFQKAVFVSTRFEPAQIQKSLFSSARRFERIATVKEAIINFIHVAAELPLTLKIFFPYCKRQLIRPLGRWAALVLLLCLGVFLSFFTLLVFILPAFCFYKISSIFDYIRMRKQNRQALEKLKAMDISPRSPEALKDNLIGFLNEWRTIYETEDRLAQKVAKDIASTKIFELIRQLKDLKTNFERIGRGICGRCLETGQCLMSDDLSPEDRVQSSPVNEARFNPTHSYFLFRILALNEEIFKSLEKEEYSFLYTLPAIIALLPISFPSTGESATIVPMMGVNNSLGVCLMTGGLFVLIIFTLLYWNHLRKHPVGDRNIGRVKIIKQILKIILFGLLSLLIGYFIKELFGELNRLSDLILSQKGFLLSLAGVGVFSSKRVRTSPEITPVGIRKIDGKIYRFVLVDDPSKVDYSLPHIYYKHVPPYLYWDDVLRLIALTVVSSHTEIKVLYENGHSRLKLTLKFEKGLKELQDLIGIKSFTVISEFPYPHLKDLAIITAFERSRKSAQRRPRVRYLDPKDAIGQPIASIQWTQRNEIVPSWHVVSMEEVVKLSQMFYLKKFPTTIHWTAKKYYKGLDFLLGRKGGLTSGCRNLILSPSVVAQNGIATNFAPALVVELPRNGMTWLPDGSVKLSCMIKKKAIEPGSIVRIPAKDGLVILLTSLDIQQNHFRVGQPVKIILRQRRPLELWQQIRKLEAAGENTSLLTIHLSLFEIGFSLLFLAGFFFCFISIAYLRHKFLKVKE